MLIRIKIIICPIIKFWEMVNIQAEINVNTIK